MGMPTGQGKTWTAHRVSSLRRVRGIHAYRSADKGGEWLTMSEAAQRLGVTNHQIRRLIKEGLLPVDPVVLVKILPHAGAPSCDPKQPARCHGKDHQVVFGKLTDCRDPFLELGVPPSDPSHACQTETH
jgi:hypothetical protein